MRTLARVAVLATAYVTAAAAASIYKWVDEKGVTHYSETPPAGQAAQDLPVAPPPPVAAPSRGIGDLNAEFARQRLQREAAAEAEQKARDAERVAAAWDQARCVLARRDLYTLEQRVPVFNIDEHGERRYIDDKDRPTAIAYARERIARYCKP